MTFGDQLTNVGKATATQGKATAAGIFLASPDALMANKVRTGIALDLATARAKSSAAATANAEAKLREAVDTLVKFKRLEESATEHQAASVSHDRHKHATIHESIQWC